MGKNRKKIRTKPRREVDKKYDCHMCLDKGELTVPIYDSYITVNCPCTKFDIEVELEVEDQAEKDLTHGSRLKKKLGKTLH